MQETRHPGLSPGSGGSSRKEMATHSSTLAWKISWMEEPSRLWSMGSQRVGPDRATSLFQFSSVAQSCLTLCNPMDNSLPGSSIHEIFQAKVLEWVPIFFSRKIFPTQGSNPGLQHCGQTLYRLSHQGSPFIHTYTQFILK